MASVILSHPRARSQIQTTMMLVILFVSLLIVIPRLSPSVHAATCPTGSGNIVEGCVNNITSGSPISGLNVYLVECGSPPETVVSQTDSNGHFSFQPLRSGCINSNQPYPVSVNGVTPVTSSNCTVPQCNVVGAAADNPAWGQWVGDVTPTGSPAYASLPNIPLVIGQVVSVPFAALYSNTGFATLTFSTTTKVGFTYTNGGGASAGIVFKIGFESSDTRSVTASSTTSFTYPPLTRTLITFPYYEIAYYCAGSSSYGGSFGWSCTKDTVQAGIAGPVPGGAYTPLTTREYLTPNPSSPPTFGLAQSSVNCQVIGPVAYTSTQDLSSSSSFTFTETVDLVYFKVDNSFGASTASGSSSSTQVSFSSTDSQTLNFLMYPATGPCPAPNQNGVLSFGPEFHVWDLSTPLPDFNMPSPSPSSFTIPPAGGQQVPLSMTGVGGFNGPVALSWAAPSPISVVFGTSPLAVSSITASTTATVNVPINTQPGTYTVTITGTNTVFALTHSFNLQIMVPGFTLTVSPAALQIADGRSGTATVQANAVDGYAGSVSLTIPSGLQSCMTGTFSKPSLQLSTSTLTDSSLLTLNVGINCSASQASVSVKGNDASGYSQSAPLILTNSEFQLSVSQATVGFASGASGSVTITANSLNGYPSSSISLSASGLSTCTGSSTSWNPSTLVVGSGQSASSVLTISIGKSCQPGLYTVTVQGNDGIITRSAVFTITVGSFTLTASPNPISVAPGGSTYTNIFASPFYGQTDSLSMSAMGLPACVTSSNFSPLNLGLPNGGYSTFTIMTSSTCATGTYPITVKAAGTSTSQTTTFTLTISSSGGGSGGSVAAGTMITQPDGSTIPVQNLKAGMKLLSYNTATHQFVVTKIVNFVTVQVNNYMNITTTTGQTLTTDQNPAQKLYVMFPNGTQTMLSVTLLQVGYYLFNVATLSWVQVTSIYYHTGGSYTMYDIYNTSPGNYVANNYLDPLKT